MDSLDPNTARFVQQVQAESQRVKLQEQVQMLAGRCWDVCLTDSRPPNKMDSKTQTCLVNCVNRMIDASAFMVEHLQKIEQKHN
uniref:Mitochondrial import inner membrane translocase subunit n=1 Tax=Ditylenchus dipsaci TaxID=166011 RepID=A0A915CQZ2_9BILA